MKDELLSYIEFTITFYDLRPLQGKIIFLIRSQLIVNEELNKII